MKSKSFKKKSLSPLISTILLVVVAVILVTLVLSFGKDFVSKNLDDTKGLEKLNVSDATYFIYSKSAKDGKIQFNYTPPSQITHDLNVTHYKVINISEMTEPIPLKEPTLISPSINILELPCLYEYSLTTPDLLIQLITSDNTYIDIKTKDNGMVCESKGTGVDGDPIVICNAEDLDNVRNNLSANYSLGKDIDLQCYSRKDVNGWEPIGNNIDVFSSNFDGKNYSINNLYINRPDQNYVGLFGKTTTGLISNFKLKDTNILGNFYVGGISGSNTSSIVDININGNIIGSNNYVGGIVGDGGNIQFCKSVATIKGKDFVGGISGNGNNGVLYFKNEFKGNVTGNLYVGGMVGFSKGNIYFSGCDSNVTCTSSYCGGLVGRTYSSSLIYRSFANTNVDGQNYTGGLVGSNESSSIIFNSSVLGTVKGLIYVGGVTGNLIGKSNILYSFFNGIVEGNQRIGGLIGNSNSNLSDFIIESYSLGTVKGSSYVGGLVGYDVNSSYSKCYSESEVIATSTYAGGLIGYQSNASGFLISDCYASGSVSGSNNVGGLIGELKGTLFNSYSSGLVNTNGTNKGGLIGKLVSGSNLSNSYYDEETSGQEDDEGKGEPKSTLELKQLYASNIWNFESIWLNSVNNYPKLQLMPFEPALEKQNDFYIIKYLEDLSLVNFYIEYNYILLNDLDFNDSSSYRSGEINLNWITGNGWEPIGQNIGFLGIFDGNSRTIKNLYVNRSSNNLGAGLFNVLYINSAVKNLILKDTNIIGYNYAGSLTGQNGGTVVNISASGNIRSMATDNTNCGGIVGANTGVVKNGIFLDGNVSAKYKVGGVVGVNWGGTIDGSYAFGNISGFDRVGCVVGENTHIYKDKGIFNSFGNCSLQGNINVGGITGSNSRTIKNSYSLSAVDCNINCGGFVGRNDKGLIFDSYSQGNVTRLSGDDLNIGGFVGYNTSSIINSYSTGKVSGNGWTPNNKGFAGVVNLTNENYLQENNFFNKITSQQNTSDADGSVGLSESEMKTQSTFEGWDFTTVWAIDEGTTYPYLRSLNYTSEFPKPK